MKGIKDHLLYYLSIILSVISVCGSAALACYGLISIADNPKRAVVCGILAVACAVVYKGLYNVRINAREKIEFDERGNKRNGEYKKLSAKEKKNIDLLNLAESERIISTGELKRITFSGSKNPEEELGKLIGLENIKEEVRKIKAKMEYEKKYRKVKGSSSVIGYHMCFMGNPGTGKTTVARIMAGILHQYGYIKKNQYIETDASFLKGTNPDETLKRTKMILDKARGGVLLIDEAYALLDGVNGAELIAEIVKHMEDNKKDFVLILAGYQNNMQRLINSNPGLHSRINRYLFFGDYSMPELRDIFTALANSAGYCVDESAYRRFEDRILKEKQSRNFGNARSVSNLFQKVMDTHAYNVMTGRTEKDKVYFITGADFG